MHQDRDEPIRNFGARIRGQARICKYSTKCQGCERDVSFMEEILRDVFIRGIADQEIQMEVLGHSNQNPSFEEALRIIEAKEADKRSASSLLDSNGAQAMRTSSSYKKEQKGHPDEPCGYCGRIGHGKRSPAKLRKQQCPAYGHRCQKCNIEHHYESVCRRSQKPDGPSQAEKTLSSSDTQRESAVFVALCSISSTPMAALVSLDHHIYDHLRNTWINCRSKPQPYISLTKMHAANNQGINILGAVALRFHGSNPQEQTVETRQLTYITGSTDTLFLSREACSALGIISNRFPAVGVASCAGQDQGAADDDPSAADSTCSCPRRQGPPPLPTRLPCSSTDENRGQLQEFRVNHYRASTFNTCKRQRLPLMDCSPQKLMINPDATPVACHIPIPVPLHWQESVKAGLDQDVQLGVLEPVPVGELVTWCHRMVVCAKKNVCVLIDFHTHFRYIRCSHANNYSIYPLFPDNLSFLYISPRRIGYLFLLQ
ncbi:hypothetical protein CAPTEDRAFT_187725 [Capitella teleta]|uniref:Uncharacterized protein n=1 Tax=Capitella teleta TaxID=283909 RepID=R7TUI0_CAPTE|nr:hypothetical protein CAPTEDRAFT_187725 [Capitella teleta]|eukprot:ELT94685.1 hypothetical protein CAPTEDRAFT_187725 [Capitella teleta]